MKIRLLISYIININTVIYCLCSRRVEEIDSLMAEDFFSNKRVEIPLKFKYRNRNGTGNPYEYDFFSPYVYYSDTEFIFPFPFHLVKDDKDDRLITYDDTPQSDFKYPTDYKSDDFLAFYRRLSDYYPQMDPEKIQVLDNGLIVSENYVKGVTGNVKIEFYEDNTGMYFTFQFDE